MLIGELSQRTGVGTHLLRYYETQGLLAPVRGANGYRSYNDDAIVTVTQIRGLLEAGLSTEDIAFLLPCASGETPDFEPCAETTAKFQARLSELDERISALTSSREALLSYLAATEPAVAEH